MNTNFQHRHSHQAGMYQSALFAPVMVSNRRLENINCIFEQSENMGGLFLGDIVSTLKPELLKEHKINAVLSCMKESNSFLIKENHISVPMSCHKVLPIHDTLDFPISFFFS